MFVCPSNPLKNSGGGNAADGYFCYVTSISIMGDWTKTDPTMWINPVKRQQVKPDRVVVTDSGARGLMVAGVLL